MAGETRRDHLWRRTPDRKDLDRHDKGCNWRRREVYRKARPCAGADTDRDGRRRVPGERASRRTLVNA